MLLDDWTNRFIGEAIRGAGRRGPGLFLETRRLPGGTREIRKGKEVS